MIDGLTFFNVERRLPENATDEQIKDAYVQEFKPVGTFTEQQLGILVTWHRTFQTSNSLMATTARAFADFFHKEK